MTETATLAAQALTATPAAVITVDSQGAITSWNPAAEALLGHAAKQAVGQTLALVVPPEHRARHIAAFSAEIGVGQLANGSCAARVGTITADDGLVVLAMSLGLLRDPAGGAGGAVTVLRSATIDLLPFVGAAWT